MFTFSYEGVSEDKALQLADKIRLEGAADGGGGEIEL